LSRARGDTSYPVKGRTPIFPALASNILIASNTDAVAPQTVMSGTVQPEQAQPEEVQHGEAHPASGLASALNSVLDELCLRSRSADWGVAREDFEQILLAIGAKYLPAEARASDAAAFFNGLRLEELALARGCAEGNERAWEVFLTRYREKLFEMALGVAREAATARELADSLYADLYGVNSRGERVSKLASYTGRGSLEGWLRTVLAQEFVNRYRKQRRTSSLDEEIEQGKQFAANVPETAAGIAGDPSPDPRIGQATSAVLDALTHEDRYVLASYYLDGRTLAAVARTLGVHESTISRRVDKLARGLRKQILTELGRRGMTRRQAEESLDTDVRDLRVDLRARLTQESAGGTFSPQEVQPKVDS
jgi:RNA polymerase sigma-70 factor (ECF subfamily)